MSDSEASKYDQDLKDLTISIKNDETEKSIDLIKKIPAEYLFYSDENGRTHLQNAINHGRNDVASALTGKKDVTVGQLLSRDKDGKSALDDAIRLEQGKRIVEILTNKNINCVIQFQTFKITHDNDLAKIISEETIAAAEKALLSEAAKFSRNFTRIDNKELETKRFEEMFEDNHSIKEGERVANEIEMLEKMYKLDNSLVNESTILQPPLAVINQQQRQ